MIALRLEQHHDELEMTSVCWLFCVLHFESGTERRGRRMFNLLNLSHNKESKTRSYLKVKSTLKLLKQSFYNY